MFSHGGVRERGRETETEKEEQDPALWCLLRRPRIPYEAHIYIYIYGFPGGASGKESACQCRRHKIRGFNPWLGKIPQRRAWQTPPYSCLESPMDRGAWQAIAHRDAKKDINEAT